MDQEFMREKKILPLVVSMSLPMVISMAVNSLYNIIDSYFVAKLSEDAMTALALVFPVQNLVTAIAVGFGIGINAAVAFYLGAGNQKQADRAASQGVFLSILHGVALTVLCIGLLPLFLRMFSAEGTVRDMAIIYADRAFLFSVMVTGGVTFEKIFQSVGKMNVSMICMMLGCVVNMLPAFCNDIFIHLICHIRPAGTGKAWTVPSPAVCIERKLRYQQKLALHRPQIQIGLAVLVFKDPKAQHLLYHFICSFLRVGIRHADQHQKASADLSQYPALRRHRRMGHSLYYKSHIPVLFLIMIRTRFQTDTFFRSSRSTPAASTS